MLPLLKSYDLSKVRDPVLKLSFHATQPLWLSYAINVLRVSSDLKKTPAKLAITKYCCWSATVPYPTVRSHWSLLFRLGPFSFLTFLSLLSCLLSLYKYLMSLKNVPNRIREAVKNVLADFVR